MYIKTIKHISDGDVMGKTEEAIQVCVSNQKILQQAEHLAQQDTTVRVVLIYVGSMKIVHLHVVLLMFVALARFVVRGQLMFVVITLVIIIQV